MSQHDFNIANQSFPATRTDLNNALVALASNSSGDAEPATKYANQWWFETDTNILKLRNQANDAWISIAVLDQSGNSVQSITTAGLTLGATAISATGAELNQLYAITRGSILYGNASGATARLAKGAAGTVLSSDGTDISWAAAAGGGSMEFIASSGNISAADFAFTQFDDSKYCNYQFVFLDIKPATNDALFEVHASADGGSTYDTGSNYKLNASAFTSFHTGAYGSTSSSHTGLNGIFHIYNAGSAKFTTSMNLMTWTTSSGQAKASGATGSAHAVDEVTDAIRFKFSSGNIASGTILMYGIKKS
tara:strand:+ start:6 stop:926 length:921 start_codon:yes stop_codon:yes gene_type:complete